MSYKLFSILVALLFISQIGNAQYTPKDKYDHESIYLKTTPFVGMRYVKDGVMKPVGFYAYRLQNELEVSPNAVMELKKYRRNSLIASGLGVLGGILFVNALNVNDNELAWIVGGLGAGIASGVLSVNAGNSLQKSIWWYNRDILRE